MLKNLIRKWLGLDETDRVLALHLKTLTQGKPVYPIDDPHTEVKKGYNGEEA